MDDLILTTTDLVPHAQTKPIANIGISDVRIEALDRVRMANSVKVVHQGQTLSLKNRNGPTGSIT